MEISEALADKSASDAPDDTPACVALGNPSCVCGKCDYKHYVSLVAKQPEVSGHIFTTHPCNLPLGNVVFKLDTKNTQVNPIFQVFYESLTDYTIRFVLE
jgi:hypothetical protein